MKNLPKFYAFYRDFNSGKLVQFDVLSIIWDAIFTSRGKIRRSFQIWEDRSEEQPIGAFVFVSNKELLKKWLISEFRYYYGSKCEYEILSVDWPYRSHKQAVEKGDGRIHTNEYGIIGENRPQKFDVYFQLKPNLDLITDLVWDSIKDKL